MRRLFVLFCLCLFFVTCSKEYFNPIPIHRVYLEVDLNIHHVLQSFPSYKIFTSKNTIHGKEQTGYAGVLVAYTIFGEYKAFDIACPNEARTDAVVEIDKDNNAVCKVCGSKFDVILNGYGGCIEGPSKYSLRPYRVLLKDNKTLIVRNY